MNPFVIEKAFPKEIKYKIGNGNVTSVITFCGIFTPEVAKVLGVRWLPLDREAAPREGFKRIELDTVIAHLDWQFKLDGMVDAILTAKSELADKFVIIKTGAKKKGNKPAKLFITFQIAHAGNPFEILEWLVKWGHAVGSLTVEPVQQAEQQPLKPAEPAPAKKRGRPKIVVLDEHHFQEAPADDEVPMESDELASARPIPTDPGVPEWRVLSEVAAGVPRFIAIEQPSKDDVPS